MKTPIETMLDKLSWRKVSAPENTEDGIPYATHEGILKLGDKELKCYVLSTGQRVIDENDLACFFGVEDMGELLKDLGIS